MRIVCLMPVAYIAGIEGFGWFLPYLALVGLMLVVVRVLKSARRAAIVVVPAAYPLELEAALA